MASDLTCRSGLRTCHHGLGSIRDRAGAEDGALCMDLEVASAEDGGRCAVHLGTEGGGPHVALASSKKAACLKGRGLYLKSARTEGGGSPQMALAISKKDLQPTRAEAVPTSEEDPVGRVPKPPKRRVPITQVLSTEASEA